MKALTKTDLFKTFTRVPSDFIDEFFGILQNKSNEEFPINIESVAKLLHSPKNALFKTLDKSYIRNEDYTVENVSQDERHQGRGGSNKVVVKLTIDCFKRFCMRSRTARSELVRTYFIEVDNFISHYSDQISDGLIKDIKTLAKSK